MVYGIILLYNKVHMKEVIIKMSISTKLSINHMAESIILEAEKISEIYKKR